MYIKIDGTYLMIDRGDSLSIPLPMFEDDRLNPTPFFMQPGDILYIGVTEPGQAFEEATIKKKIKYDNVGEDGIPVLKFYPNDTLYLETGKYFLSVKLFRGIDGNVFTVLTLTDFFILGTDIDPYSHCYDDEHTNTGNVVSVNGKIGEVVLDAEDVGALPDTTKIPTKTSELENDSDFVDESFLGIALSNYATKDEVKPSVVMQQVTINGQDADDSAEDKVSFEIYAEDIPVESRLLRNGENVKSVLINLQNQIATMGTDLQSLDTKLSDFLGLPEEDLDTLSELIEMIKNADEDTLAKLTAQIEKKVDKSNIITSLQELNENANSTEKVISAKAAAEMLDEHDSLANEVQENENRIVNLENAKVEVTTGEWFPYFWDKDKANGSKNGNYILYDSGKVVYDYSASYGKWTKIKLGDIEKVFVEVFIRCTSTAGVPTSWDFGVLLPFACKNNYTPLTLGLNNGIARYESEGTVYSSLATSVELNANSNVASLYYLNSGMTWNPGASTKFISFSGWYTPTGDLITIG